MNKSLAALAVSLAFVYSAPVSALTFTPPAITPSTSVAKIINTNTLISTANMWIKTYQTLTASNTAAMARIQAMSEPTRTVIMNSDTYQYYLTANAYYADQITQLSSLKPAAGTPVEVSRTNTVTKRVETVTGLPTVVRELVGMVFTEKSGNIEKTFRETSKLIRTTTTSITYSITTTVVKFSDGSSKTTSSEVESNRSISDSDSSTASRELISERILTSDEIAKAAVWQTPEYLRSTGLSRIHADEAYQQGWSGKNVIIGVIDSGYSTTQTIDRPTNMLPGKNFLVGGDDVNDTVGHGTHVTGIIAAPKNDIGVHGLAYDSTILPLKAMGTTTGNQLIAVAQAVDYAVQSGAKVINMSLGAYTGYNTVNNNYASFDINFGATYLKAVQSGATIVVAAGNNGASCKPVSGIVNCSFPAALPLVNGYETLTTSKGGWISVGAVDANNVLAVWSNKAGVMKDYYMVAPGVSITSTVSGNKTAVMSGTSMAAPYVTGAIALLTEKFPYLNGSDHAQILFRSATDLGAPGVDDVYGNGLLNLERAMQPIGQLRLPTSNTVSGPSRLLSTTSIATNPLIVKALSNSEVLKKTVALDDYNRTYQIDMSKAVTSSNTPTFSFDGLRTVRVGSMSIASKPNSDGVTAIGMSLFNNMFLTVASDTSVDTSGTYYRLAYEKSIEKNMYLGGALDYGSMKMKTNSNMISLSQVQMVGGAAWFRNNYSDRTSYTLGLRLPMTPVSGSAKVTSPTSRTMDGTIVYETERVSLASKPQQVGAFVNYSHQLSDTQSVFAYGTVQHNSNDEQNRTTAMVNIAYSVSF